MIHGLRNVGTTSGDLDSMSAALGPCLPVRGGLDPSDIDAASDVIRRALGVRPLSRSA